MSTVVIDEDVYAGVAPTVVSDAAAEAEQIQQALMAGDQPIELEATAAGGDGGAGGGHPLYVVNVPGTVLGESRTERGSGHADVHVRLGTGMGELPVHLGPDFWVDAQALGIARGDQVRVRGSMVSIDGKPAIIAEAVTWGTATLQLRSSTGAPAWTAVSPH